MGLADGPPIPPPTVRVPAGAFVMGDVTSPCAGPARDVELTRDFRLGRHEVTNAEYLAALRWAYEKGLVTADSTGVYDRLDGSDKKLLDLGSQFCEIRFDGSGFTLRSSPSEFAAKAYPEGYDPADHPVKEVSWYGAASYCDWLSLSEDLPRVYDHTSWRCTDGDPYAVEGYRLPTEAEWERAARWPEGRPYPWGDAAPSPDRVNANLIRGWTSPVESYDANPLGLFDLAGNVWEWCGDWRYCQKDSEPAVDPTGPATGSSRVRKGGSWRHFPEELRSAGSRGGYEYNTYAYVGFRLCIRAD